MKKFVYVLLLLVCLNLVGCAPSISHFKPDPDQKVNPVGLYVIIGGFGGSIEADYREDLTKRFIEQITSSMSSKGYKFIKLNEKFDQKDVYRSSLVWYVNEKKIARLASRNGCETAYIVFYYLENLGGWKNMQGSGHFLIKRWLVDTPTGKILAEDGGYVPSPMANISRFTQNGEDKSSRKTHIRYLDWLNQSLFNSAAPITQ